MAEASYWDIASFLAENQKLPCTFQLDVPNLGHLEGTGERDLRRGTTIELPFWLGLDLASVQDRLALPKSYASRVRNALNASAQSVSLKALNGGAFFPAGVRLNSTIQDDKLRETMHTAFKTRLAEIFDHSQHDVGHSAGAQDAADFIAGLDDWEKELFLTGEGSARAMRAWTEQRKQGASDLSS